MENLFDAFGISTYHAIGIKGQGVSIMVIDTGMSSATFSHLPKNAKHGLAVSSILSGADTIPGICPMAKIEMLDLQDSKNIPMSKVLRAIELALNQNFDILSISLGTTDSWEPMQELIEKALQQDMLVFAAAGNSGDRGYEYPAACKGAISVASMNFSRQPSAFNTRNDATVIFAPGEELQLSLGNGNLAHFSGTSFATPFAAGLAALILSKKRFDAEKTEKTKEFSKVFIPRAEMILLLRDMDHLGLNCTTHTYVMESTCTETRYVNREREKIPIHYGMLLLLLFIVSYFAYSVKCTL